MLDHLTNNYHLTKKPSIITSCLHITKELKWEINYTTFSFVKQYSLKRVLFLTSKIIVVCLSFSNYSLIYIYDNKETLLFNKNSNIYEVYCEKKKNNKRRHKLDFCVHFFDGLIEHW